jgi:raffinose/stachyose/melibiose transport system substrate-binding protein
MKTSSFLMVFFIFLIPTLFATGSKEAGGSSGPVVLTMWDDYTTPSRHDLIGAVIKEFQDAHPGVTVQETSRPLEATTTAVMAGLNAGAGPDITLANNGETQMGPLVRAGHLVNLSPYSAKYGWEKNYLSPSLWDRAKYTADGKTFGQGNLYGVPLYGELVGVYYNKDIFAKLGLQVPQTVADFEDILAKVKAAGITPIAYGAAEIWPFYQIYADILSATLTDQIGADATQKWFSDVVIHWKPENSFADPAALQAARIMKSWADKGYFFKDFTGMKIIDALKLFQAGQAALFIQGTWFAPDVGQAKFRQGLFAFPPMKKGQALISQVGGMATPLGINANSKNQALVAEFLNTMLSSDKVHKMESDLFLLPPVVPLNMDGVSKDSLFFDIGNLWNLMNKQDRVGQYLDWTTPDMGNFQGTQELMSGAATPEQFVASMQAVYQAWIDKRAKM